jgi:hypothetical protein
VVDIPVSEVHEAAIAAFVASLDLQEKVDPELFNSDDIELCLHQLEILRLFIWSKGLDPFIRFYARRFVRKGEKMADEHFEKCIDIANDEYAMNGTRLLIRRFLEGESVTLNELVENVFRPKSKDYSDYRKRLRDNILLQMEAIGLWSYTEEIKTSKSGGSYHAGYHVTAGPTLLAFHRHVYIPLAKMQTKFACKLLAQMEN